MLKIGGRTADFLFQVELILPEEVYDLVWKDVEQKISSDEYFRVILRLSDILDGDFFNSYIKKGWYYVYLYHILSLPFNSQLIFTLGNILMLSEGRPGIDDLFFLKEGTPGLWAMSPRQPRPMD